MTEIFDACFQFSDAILQVTDRVFFPLAICLLCEAKLFATSLEINVNVNFSGCRFECRTYLWHFLVVSHGARATAFATTGFGYCFCHSWDYLMSIVL